MEVASRASIRQWSRPFRVAHAGGAAEPARLPGGRGRRAAPPAGREPDALARGRAAARRDAALAGRGHLAERTARPDAARGPRPDHDPQGGGRPARAAAGRLRHLPVPQRGRLHRRVHRRPQAAGQRQPVRRPRRPAPRPGGHAQRGPQRRRRARVRAGRRGRDAQGAARRRRPRPGDRERRRGARRTPRRAAARGDAACRRLAAARRPLRLRLRAGAQVRGRGAGPRGGPGHRLRRHRRAVRADRDDPRRRRAALPPPRDVRRARAEAPEGRAALRPARLRQDADRQGGRELAGQEGRGPHRPGGQELLPEHQGPRAAQQVRRRDRAAHPAGVPAGPREGQRGHPGHRVLRRDGLAVPHPRVGRLLRRREHHRAAAAQRDRRRRDASRTSW